MQLSEIVDCLVGYRQWAGLHGQVSGDDPSHNGAEFTWSSASVGSLVVL